jgi:benzodiazapine receptor
VPIQYRSWLVLALFILVCLGVGALGSAFAAPSMDVWYPALRKPSWTPPPAVFRPVWTVLYVLMAIAAWLVWRRRSVADTADALYLFTAQLAFNLAWSAFFFALRSPGAALIDVVLLWGLVLVTLVSFWRIRPLAGALLLPYLLWVTYGVALNFAIWQMN